MFHQDDDSCTIDQREWNRARLLGQINAPVARSETFVQRAALHDRHTLISITRPQYSGNLRCRSKVWHRFANLEKDLLWIFRSVVPNLPPICVVDCKLKFRRVFVEPSEIFVNKSRYRFHCVTNVFCQHKMRYSTKKRNCNTNDYR